MLRTNSKEVKEKIRSWIINNFDFSNYEGCGYIAPKDYEETKQTIALICWHEKSYQVLRLHDSLQNMFVEWCQGLPSVIDTASYYCHGSAVDLVGDILEQTKEERAKYSEVEAENLMTHLIFKEVFEYLRDLYLDSIN